MHNCVNLVLENFELKVMKHDTSQEPANITASGKCDTIVEMQPTQQANNTIVGYKVSSYFM